jgi:hypothetical protein
MDTPINTPMGDQPVVDAEIVNTPTSDAPAADNAAQVLLDLENLIKSNIASIDAHKAELSKQREMLDSALQNDETYREHDKAAKEAAKVKMKTKQQILQLPANKQLVEKVKEAALEGKEAEGALSDYLREYQRMSGATEIELDDGEIREIVNIPKLLKKSQKFGR